VLGTIIDALDEALEVPSRERKDSKGHRNVQAKRVTYKLLSSENDGTLVITSLFSFY
jgi:hypothetical protein